MAIYVCVLAMGATAGVFTVLWYQRIRVSRRRAPQAAVREAEFRLLETPPKPIDGRVWGCAKWADGCDSRIVETPPYDSEPPSGRCGTHGLPMDTKTAERRTAAAVGPQDDGR
jgi:hypothetical protein